MAGKTVALTKPMKELVKEIGREFYPATIFLFGSRTTKDYFNYSDWDLLIISEKFEGIPFRERIDKILELYKQPIGQDVEPLCYTPKEISIRKKENGIVKNALEKGIILNK